jgi:hypothetical protein
MHLIGWLILRFKSNKWSAGKWVNYWFQYSWVLNLLTLTYSADIIDQNMNHEEHPYVDFEKQPDFFVFTGISAQTYLMPLVHYFKWQPAIDDYIAVRKLLKDHPDYEKLI